MKVKNSQKLGCFQSKQNLDLTMVSKSELTVPKAERLSNAERLRSKSDIATYSSTPKKENSSFILPQPSNTTKPMTILDKYLKDPSDFVVPNKVIPPSPVSNTVNQTNTTILLKQLISDLKINQNIRRNRNKAQHNFTQQLINKQEQYHVMMGERLDALTEMLNASLADFN